MTQRAGLAQRVTLSGFAGCVILILLSHSVRAQTNTPASQPAGTNRQIVMIQGTVEVARAGTVEWKPAHLNQALNIGDRVRTGERSKAEIYYGVGRTDQMKELSQLEITGPEKPERPPSVNILRGFLKIFDRDPRPNSEFRSGSGATAAVRGTDLIIKVDDDGSMEVTVLDGEVLLSNESGKVLLGVNEQGIATRGAVPRRTAVIEAATAKDLVQWSLYYPGVLDPDELAFSANEKAALSASLEAYRLGDLPRAADAYPWNTPASTADGRAYRAAMMLTVGQVEEARALLREETSSAAQAIEVLITATRFETLERTTPPSTASQWLAESYYRQSKFQLGPALEAARAATSASPNFGYAWERIAELEFGFGRTSKAHEALNRALELSPRNAQAIALRGFLLAAQNKTRKALGTFDQAIEADPALANAWLGRGLCKFRLGLVGSASERALEAEPGDGKTSALADLTVAASLESQRSVLRSYLGKAFAEVGDERHAAHELDLAKELDPSDPTPWLYSALLRQEQHRYNEAIEDLDQSQALNQNRRIYRSRMLLDQDRAVRGTALAAIYRDNGMTEVSTREASHAVTYDYANYSAHLFLANSFDLQRDPTRFNLRYETAWFNELLLANMLAPPAAGIFAQNISQQEYSRLFERDKIGLTTTTDARSDNMYHEAASFFGNFDRFGYSLDLDYHHNDGVRPNNDLNSIEWYSQFKFALTPADTLFLLLKYQDYHSGDNFQYYDPNAVRTDLLVYGITNAPVVRTNFTFDETQTPIVIGGFHHQWSPGNHTLVLAGRLENDQRFSDSLVPELIVFKNGGTVSSAAQFPLDITYRGQFDAVTTELEQILHNERHTLQFGGRYQDGQFKTSNEMFVPSGPTFAFATNLFSSPAATTNTINAFRRATAYAYYTFEPLRDLFLTAGVAYDHVEYPLNHRNPPIGGDETSANQVGPKAAVVYGPADWVTLRGTFTRSLGGVTLDQSYRLEPTSLAGFIQTFRSVIPESVVGSVSAPVFETYGAAVDFKFKTRTYVGLQYVQLVSSVDQEIGVYDVNDFGTPFVPSATPERLSFREHIPGITVNQLLGTEWSCGVSYRFTSSQLNTHLENIPTYILTSANDSARSDLHQVGAFLQYTHRSGFFARAEVNWYHQNNVNETVMPAGGQNVTPIEMQLPGDEFTQVNLFAGWHFPRQFGDITFGVLNVGGGDYRLNPLNSYPELPRERVYAGQLRLRF